MIFVNFKTYKQATGKNAVNLTKICKQVAEISNVKIIPIVQSVDLYLIKQNVKIPLWTQNINWEYSGPFTGHINLETVIAAGASGTLLNHSENKLKLSLLIKTMKRIKETQKKFKTMVCAEDLNELITLQNLNPDFLAYEPPELIGSKTNSVALSHPEIIKKAVNKIHSLPLIVGAGIRSFKDVEISIKNKAKGILVSSAVVISKNPKDKLLQLAKAFS